MTPATETGFSVGAERAVGSQAQSPAAPPPGTGLARYAKLVAGATFVLVFAGGLVTSTGSGLAVPDWPTTFGYNLFTFPPSKWVGGIRYEHTHRLIASLVGLLTIGLCVWLLLREQRRWIKVLGIAALAAVVVQGLLGGLTVVLLLPPPVSIAHGSLAQGFFCMTVALASVTARSWRIERAKPASAGLRRLHRLALVTAALVFVQLVVGAIMRHAKAGLAIPDFPLAFGRLLPPLGDPKVAIHFAHRVMALLVAVHVALVAARVFRRHREDRWLVRPAALLLALTALQVALGAGTVWSGKDVLLTTGHVAAGAAILATAVVLALRSHRSSALGVEPSELEAAECRASRAGDLLALVKIRLTTLVLATTVAGFYLASAGPLDWGLLVSAVLGTGLLAGGASALNQYLERDVDRDMIRTANRPIPAGRMRPAQALAAGAVLSASGLGALLLFVNALTAAVGAATLLLYLFAYTPLKRRTAWCTVVGAVAGALPPVMGWTAALGRLSVEAAILFAILFFWQMPHFLAIAMIHREDYARAGLSVLSVDDPDGRTTARHLAAYCVALVPASLAPSMLGLSGSVYFVGALALGVSFLLLALAVAVRRSRLAARGLFLASLVYLPILLGLMTADKL